MKSDHKAQMLVVRILIAAIFAVVITATSADAQAPCSRWKGAEVHRSADAVHGWQYPEHIGGTVHTRPDGKSAPRLFNPELRGVFKGA
jgi:hypothetical protein